MPLRAPIWKTQEQGRHGSHGMMSWFAEIGALSSRTRIQESTTHRPEASGPVTKGLKDFYAHSGSSRLLTARISTISGSAALLGTSAGRPSSICLHRDTAIPNETFFLSGLCLGRISRCLLNPDVAQGCWGVAGGGRRANPSHPSCFDNLKKKKKKNSPLPAGYAVKTLFQKSTFPLLTVATRRASRQIGKTSSDNPPPMAPRPPPGPVWPSISCRASSPPHQPIPSPRAPLDTFA